MIELRHLRTLMALKESGSLAGAAKKRFVTQSALSHQIKELESKIKEAEKKKEKEKIKFLTERANIFFKELTNLEKYTNEKNN